jgi:hypothetical protein
MTSSTSLIESSVRCVCLFATSKLLLNKLLPPPDDDVSAIIAAPVPATVWALDGKGLPAMLSVSADREWIVARAPGAAADVPAIIEVPADAVTAVAIGNPAAYKKKIFGRNANKQLSLVCEDHKGAALLHVELASSAVLALVAKAIVTLCKIEAIKKL